MPQRRKPAAGNSPRPSKARPSTPRPSIKSAGGSLGGAPRPSAKSAVSRKQKGPKIAKVNAQGMPVVSAPQRTTPKIKATNAKTQAAQPLTPTPIASAEQKHNRDVMVTRRRFLYGAVGLGALAAGAGGVSYFMTKDDEVEIPTLTVDEVNVATTADCTELNRDDTFNLVRSFDIAFGTLVWANNDTVAATLLPTEKATPLTQAGVLMLDSGDGYTVLEKAVGADEGFEIYDVRASATGYMWTEANILENLWRIYGATLSNKGILGQSTLLDEGSGDWEVPTIALVGSSAFWQRMPRAGSDSEKQEESSLMRCPVSGGQPEVLYTSKGRMCSPVYACEDGVVITPRVPETNSYYQLVHIAEQTGAATDTLVLPSGMKPLEAAYGTSGFSFCFESIYSYGGGIANLGTYTPTSKPASIDAYNTSEWFRFGRTPTTAPAWCKDWFIVKSTTSVCAVDMNSLAYVLFDTESGCTDWGDYLASSGTGNRIVTVMNIDDTATDGTVTKKCTVRIWEPK